MYFIQPPIKSYAKKLEKEENKKANILKNTNKKIFIKIRKIKK